MERCGVDVCCVNREDMEREVLCREREGEGVCKEGGERKMTE